MRATFSCLVNHQNHLSMIGGAGFSKLAEVINKNNRNLLKRDEPFDKIRSNPLKRCIGILEYPESSMRNWSL